VSFSTSLPVCAAGKPQLAVDVESRELWRLGARSQVIYLKL